MQSTSHEPSLELCPAGAPDFDELLPLVRAYHAFEGVELDDVLRQAGLRQLLAEPSLGRAWLIREGRTTVGYGAICRGFSLEFGGYDGFLDELFLIEPARGRGLGARVLAALPALAAALDIRKLHLEVARDNVPARRLYARAGFVAREKYVLMSRDID